MARKVNRSELNAKWGRLKVDISTARYGAISMETVEDVDGTRPVVMTLDEVDALADWLKDQVRLGREAHKSQ